MTPADLAELEAAWPGPWVKSPMDPDAYTLKTPPKGWDVYAHINRRKRVVITAERQVGALIVVGIGRRAVDAVRSFREDCGQTASAVNRLHHAAPKTATTTKPAAVRSGR